MSSKVLIEDSNAPSSPLISKPRSSTIQTIDSFLKYQLTVSNNPNIPKTDNLLPEQKSNSICTSKYTFFTALPKILFEQFSQISNIYFLALAILQCFGEVSQAGGTPILFLPIAIVVGLNGIKDFAEDYKRKQSDENENASKTILIEPFGCREIQWRDVTPGQILKIQKNEYFPADILMIYSTNKNGAAFVETKNLDGETNLKYKESVKYFYNIAKAKSNSDTDVIDEKDAKSAVMEINANLMLNSPDAKMYEFSGMATPIGTENEVPIGLEYNNLMLRGSSLRNTEYIFGIVIYAGHHTKIMLNSLTARGKQSSVTKKMQKILFIILLFQFLISLVFSVLFKLKEKDFKVVNNVYGQRNFFLSFFSWVLLINNLVPISLLVTMEMIRYFQAFFIINDVNIYDRVNRRKAVVQSSGLNEELGQVHYIFTDKTGTLTKNVMQFKYVVIGNFTYGSEKHADPSSLKLKGVTNVDFVDDNLMNHWNDQEHENSGNIENFIFSLALCHTVIAEPDPKIKGKFSYNASSPDELALVNGAKYLGVEFIERTADNDIILLYKGEQYVYKLLHILEFNSDRKRMGIVIRNIKTNQILIIEKGADATLLPLMNSFYNENNPQVKYTLKELEGFGEKGLRTLIFVSRVISQEEWDEYNKEYTLFLKGVYQSQREKDLKLFELYETIEREFNLLGATSIEDCLQDDLKETLSSFRDVGIKVFMLTGDHPFTAISIAHSSGLMEENDIAEIVDSTSKVDVLNRLSVWIDKSPLERETDGPQVSKALVITGNSLIQIYKESERGQLHFALKNAISKSACVICSRVSPKQKADIVHLVKGLDTSKICLAIGDGANDVNMINVADIGIGIFGNEGQQAARASDYAIGQFSFLKRLLFIYGRESYRKNSFSICYILWKNCLYSLPLILYSFFSKFSAQLFYDSIFDALYNVLFTALPIGWYATIDRETSFEKLISNPKRYRRGMKNKYFNAPQIVMWYGYAFITGSLIFFSHYSIQKLNVTYYHQKDFDIYSLGASITTVIITIVNVKLIFYSSIHTVYTFILMIVTILSFIIIFIVGSFCFPFMDIYGVFPMLFYNLNFYAMIFMLIMSYFAIEYIWNSFWRIIHKEKKKFKKKIEEKRKKEQAYKKKDFTIKLDRMYTGYAFSHDAFDRMFQGGRVFKPSSSFRDVQEKIIEEEKNEFDLLET